MGKAPTLTDDDFVLWESGAILYYLAQKHGGAIWPKDARGQADAMRWLFFTSCHVDPYLTTLVIERVLKARRQEQPDEAMVRGADGFLARFIPVIEQQLATREYVTGRFGLADIALGCSMELSAMLKVDLGPYPNVRAWLARLHARASWGGPGPEAFPSSTGD
jgi:glutathione S-transferase